MQIIPQENLSLDNTTGRLRFTFVKKRIYKE